MKRMIAIALFVVLVSTMAATSIVSAKQSGQSDIRQYDVKARYTSDIVGTLTVNVANGHYAIEANWGKAASTVFGFPTYKDYIKQITPKVGIIHADNGAASTGFGSVVYTKGGTAHGKGTLDTATVEWLKANGDGATFYMHRVYS